MNPLELAPKQGLCERLLRIESEEALMDIRVVVVALGIAAQVLGAIADALEDES